LPRTLRAAPGEPAGRFGHCDHIGVAARRTLLPAILHISQGLADRWGVDDNHAFQPSALGTGRTRLTSRWTSRLIGTRLGLSSARESRFGERRTIRHG
jgi:hypothetical protein